MEKRNAKALLPIAVFVVLYLGLGILFEYGLNIEMGFYKIPVVIIFLLALLVACLQNRKLSLNDKLKIMGVGISDPNIITMIIIFMLAGIFVGVVGRTSANSVAYFILSLIPPQFAVVVLFVVSCFVSLAMGTSVGTITLITPIGIAVSRASGFDLPLCIATVMGGAMFGDNLSFISDTTIAACNGQGCKMTDKFKENFFIALPAAIVSLVIIYNLSVKNYSGGVVQEEYHLIQAIPYILVLAGGILGLNVFLVLITGIISGSIIMIATGMIVPTDLLGNMGDGAAGMFETSMVAILVASICALIKEYGGFAALLYWIKKVFKGRKGGLLGMGLLVGLMDIATANNTVAIVMANPIAQEMSGNYGISNKKAASILDTFSCIFQGILPYGAQMLVAISAASGLGVIPAVSKMAFGNKLGVKLEHNLDPRDAFAPGFGSIVAEVPAGKVGELSITYTEIGEVTVSGFSYGNVSISTEEALDAWKGTLEKVFPTVAEKNKEVLDTPVYKADSIYVCKHQVAKPTVFIPVFPGTNCEYDSTKAFERAGANVVTKVFKNLSESDIKESVDAFEKAISQAQIIMFPGGFSAGDEPDGSAKFFATAFQNEKIKEEVMKLLKERDGLCLGICNGFQALIKLGLVPYGEIVGQKDDSPTLTFNTINRHISKMVYTKVVSNKSPWLQGAELGKVYVNPASHGEGRFVAPKEWIDKLFANGQVATQYSDPEGRISMDEEWNINGSYSAIEGITSPDGRILGKMAHSERRDRSVAQNIYGEQDLKIFESGVAYFK